MMPPLPWRMSDAEVTLSGKRLGVCVGGRLNVGIEMSDREASAVWAVLGVRRNVVGVAIKASAVEVWLTFDGVLVRIGSIEVRRRVRRDRTWDELALEEQKRRKEQEEACVTA